MAEENTEKSEALDLSGLGSFDFTPAWAKGRPDDKTKFARFEEREDRGERRASNERRSFGERKGFGERRP